MMSLVLDYNYWYKPCYILIMKKIFIGIDPDTDKSGVAMFLCKSNIFTRNCKGITLKLVNHSNFTAGFSSQKSFKPFYCYRYK